MPRFTKAASLALCLFLPLVGLSAQQITRIAVVDLQKVLLAYSTNSAALRDYEAKKAGIQQQIDSQAADIKTLQAQKADADKAMDTASSQRLDAEIAKRTDALRSFVRSKQAELEKDAAALNSTDAFAQLVYQKIQNVAETEGYSLVVNLRSTDSVMNAVLWYSPMIDITDKVITALVGTTAQ